MNHTPSPNTLSDAYFAEVMADIMAACDAPAQRKELSRRGILKLSVAGGGLMLAFSLGGHTATAATAGAKEPAKDFGPNAFVRIAPSGEILILNKGPEIGQGIKTAFPLIVAEELDAKWSDVKIEQALVKPEIYGRQSAGGSTSIPNNWDLLRQAGAVARSMLVSAAAKQWNVKENECTTADSEVTHTASGRKLKYGDLAMKAAALPVPDPKTVPLKTRDQYRLLGKRYTGVDNAKIVTGQPLYGIDQKLPGMVYATYTKCPAVGGKVVSANLDHVKQMPGVKDAFVVEGTGNPAEVMPGVAIIADSTWAAFKAKAALQVQWDESKASKDSWTGLSAKAREIAMNKGAETLHKHGDVDAAFAGAAKKLDAFYSYPFLPHATLEPQNTTAWFKGDEIELWVPTQSADRGRQYVAKAVNLPLEKVIMHQTRVGGGFGRRLVNDPVCEVTEIAKKVNGPVKLMWTREDDMRHDFYRPGGFHQFSGALDEKGKLIGWRGHFITFTGDGKKPVTAAEIAGDEFPLPIVANAELTQTMLPLMTPTGYWRAPGSNGIAFCVQSFIAELATLGGRDHIEFFLEILGEPRWLKEGNANTLNTGRAAAVTKLVAEKAGWGRKMEPGRGLGFGFHFSHAGHFAEVAEVSVDAQKKITVHKVWVAGDIGQIINMSGAEHQAQAGVIDALSTMMRLQVAIEDGRIREANFNEYPILRMPEAPQVEVHFIQSDFKPTGLGEPALPPAMPAISNAIFAATGTRYRSMPLRSSTGLST